MIKLIPIYVDNVFESKGLVTCGVPFLQECNYLYHSALNALASEAMSQSRLLWKLRPKLHRLEHIVYDQCRKVNPLWVACYGDEDMVGKVKSMCTKASARHLELQVLNRYCAFICLRWQRVLNQG